MNEVILPPRVLYVVACASRPAQRIQDFVVQAQETDWQVCVIVTPQATKFVDIPLLEKLTGYPVRSEYKRPEEPDVLPAATAIVGYPATFNTLNKWALGISDTLAVGLLCEYTGLKKPVLAVPCVLTASGLDTHPAFARSIDTLISYGVRIIYEPDKYPPKNEVPWDVVLDELRQMCGQYEAPGD